MDEPLVAFSAPVRDAPAIEVLVNFGLFAGRAPTDAEIDRLVARLLPYVGELSIVAETRHEVAEASEASVCLVRIEVPGDRVDGDVAALQRRVVAHAETWARDCISDRTLEL